MLSTRDHNRLRRRLRPLYAAAFLQGFVFWYTIEKLFMSSIGFDSQSIAIETIIFTVVMLLTNVPLGVLADRWSRKGVLVFASVSLGASSLICGLSNEFWTYVAGASCWGLFFAAYAGLYDTIIYDVMLEESGRGDHYEHYYGRVQLVDSIALVTSSLLGGLIAHFVDFRAAYFLTIPFCALSVGAILRFKEPKVHKKDAALMLGAHLRETLRALVATHETIWIGFSLVMLGVASRLILEFYQLWLIALALPVVLYGPVNALVLSSLGVGGPLAAHIKTRKMAILTGVSMLAAALALPVGNRPLLIATVTLLVCGLTIVSILLNRRLHDALPSRVRNGATSAIVTLGYLVFLPAAFWFGHLGTGHGALRSTWVVVITIVLMLGGSAAVMWRRKNLSGGGPNTLETYAK